MSFISGTRRRGTLALVGTVVLALAATASPGTAGEHVDERSPSGQAFARTEQAPAPHLTWGACGRQHPGIRCATAEVPLDYDHPLGRTTRLALTKVPAADRAHRIGTVFVNPGGPGGSGVDLVLHGFGEQLAADLHGRFDVVGFDPRGVGRSDPLHCFASEDALARFFYGVPVFPYRKGQYQPFYHRWQSLGDRCLHRHQAIVRHMSTADVVRDLDLLRRAVGDKGLTFLGFSYGSYIGNTYANLFPRRVRALVIDGVLNPRRWARGAQIRSDRVATKHEFVEFLRLCDAARRGCAFWEPGGSRQRWNALARTVRTSPVRLDDLRYTYDLLITDAVSVMYAPEVWGGRDGYAQFLDQVADTAEGPQRHHSATAAAAARLRAALLTRLSPREAQYQNGLDAYYGNQCADTQYPSSLRAFRAVGAHALAGSRFGPYWWWSNTGCTHWPVAPDRYTGPWVQRTSNPVLVVGNYFDGVTGYTGARASARFLRGSRLLTYAGWGHTAYGRSDCITHRVDAYLLRRALPARGTVCPANPNPFLPSAKRSDSAELPLVGLPPLSPVSR